MGIGSAFSVKPATRFAEELAQALHYDLPPKLLTKAGKAISANRVTIILERNYAKAATFQKESQMNGFQRAFFANTFRWRLNELGYPREFIEVATQGLLIHLAKTKRRAD